jgi:Protein of unknown function (DUF3631)
MSEEQAVATGLWIMLTYVEAHVDVLPILAVTSPQKRCGKTRLLSILQRIVRKPLPASSITPAALYRCIEKWTPTILVDEADTFLPNNDELRGVLNAGHTRPMAFVIRTNTETMEPECFSTWAPKAIACIGKLPSTLTDRSIEIRMQRRTQAERIVPLRDSKRETFDRLQQQLARWTLDHGEKLSAARPGLPPILNDRAVDNWLPLLAIAELAGDKWPDLATKTAVVLNAANDSAETIQTWLLLALQEIFVAGIDFLSTDEILEILNGDEEAPWADWEKKMTAKKLAAKKICNRHLIGTFPLPLFPPAQDPRNPLRRPTIDFQSRSGA